MEVMSSSGDLRRDMYAGIIEPRSSLCPCAALRCCHIPTLPQWEMREGGSEKGWRHGCGREYRLGVGSWRGISLIGPPCPSEDHPLYCTGVFNPAIHCTVRGAASYPALNRGHMFRTRALPTSVIQNKCQFLHAQDSATKREPEPGPCACATHYMHSWAEYRESLHRMLFCRFALSVKKVMHEHGCGSQGLIMSVVVEQGTYCRGCGCQAW